MKINKFLGLIQAASPYSVPPGAATEQVNAMSLTPGQLTVRGGMKTIATATSRLLEMWGLSAGSSSTDKVLAFDRDGAISEFTGIGGEVTQETRYSGLSPDHPVSFCQGRRGEVYIYQGYGQRGLVRGTDGKIRLVGLEAPASKPEITIDSSASYYVARIDLTDVGNGYHLPPAVYIGPPPGQSNAATSGPFTNTTESVIPPWAAALSLDPAGTPYETPYNGPGRQAKAIARIGNAQVSEVEVTDGGKGYTSTPCVQFKDQPGLAVTGTGASAALKLKKGFAKGDPDTGVVFWEVTELPRYWWLCLSEYEREGNGFIVPASGGSGSGAKCIFMFPDSFFSKLRCFDPSSDGTDLADFEVGVQVYDFGTGYKAGDEITATLHTASSFQAGSGFNGPVCSTTATCQLKARGYCISDPKCPDKLTVVNASPYKQRAIDPIPANAGKGYMTPPTFTTEDGDVIETEVDCYGRITKLVIQNQYKTYLFAPKLLNTDGDVGGARGLAIMRATLRGKYQCYVRYANTSVPEKSGGPIYSSLSPVNEIDCGDHAAKLTWSIPPKGSWAKGATAIELWRSTSDQAITLFRVATLTEGSSFVDELSDYDLTTVSRDGFLALPILLEDGALNANRHGVASTDFAVGVVFQDRAFLSVDTTGARPNTLMYSEADEPESMPETNELILQSNVRDADYITALIPYAGALMVMQSSHCNRLNFVTSPAMDATTSLVAYRGCLNQRCWDIYMGEAYVLDDFGLYKINEQGQVEHLFAPLDTMVRANTDKTLPVIDFSKRKWFFIRSDGALGVIRMHVSFAGDEGEFPTRQIVYDIDTQGFWTEDYPAKFSCATDIRDSSGSVIQVTATEKGICRFAHGLTDDGAPIPWSWKTGNMAFVTDETVKNGGSQNPRTVSVTFRTTDQKCLLNMGLYYNNSQKPRPNVARRDRGVGFVADENEPKSSVDMQLLPHPEGESKGLARAVFAGKTIADFAGSDAHVAVRLYGEQTEAGAVILHGLDIQGVEE
jgi:hypothetical protein